MTKLANDREKSGRNLLALMPVLSPQTKYTP